MASIIPRNMLGSILLYDPLISPRHKILYKLKDFAQLICKYECIDKSPQKEIVASLLNELLKFEEMDLEKALYHIGTLHSEFEGYPEETQRVAKEYKERLFEAFYTYILKKNITTHELSKVIQDLDCSEKFPRVCWNNLVECFSYKKDSVRVLEVVECMNNLEEKLYQTTLNSLVPFLREAIAKKDQTSVIAFMSLIYRKSEVYFEGQGSLYSYLEEFDKEKSQEKIEIIGDLLEAAILTKQKSLFIDDCLEALFNSGVDRNGYSESHHFKVELYTKIRPIPELKNIISILLLEKYYKFKGCTNERILSLISFLALYPGVSLDDNFNKIIESLIKDLNAQTKKDFILFLIYNSIHSESLTVVTRVFDLIIYFKLDQDPDFRPNMMRILCRLDSASEGKWIINVFNSTIDSFHNPEKKNVTIKLLDEFLDNLNEEDSKRVFTLLGMGMSSNYKDFINRCLQAIQEHNLYAEMPSTLRCSMLLQLSTQNQLTFYHSYTLIQLPSDSADSFAMIPEVILTARAPRLSAEIRNARISKEGLIKLLAFVLDDDLKIKEREEFLEFYEFAHQARMGYLILRIQEKLLRRYKFKLIDVTLLLKYFELSKGRFRNEIKNILLALATRTFENRDFLKVMETISPGLFERINVEDVFAAKESYITELSDQELRKYGHLPVIPRFIDVPGVKFLDFGSIEFTRLDSLKVDHPKLEGLALNNRDQKFDGIESLNITTLEFYRFDLELLFLFLKTKIHSIYFKSLSVDFWHKKEIFNNPQVRHYLENLRVFSFSYSKYMVRTPAERILLFIYRMTKLVELHIDGCSINNLTLNYINIHQPNLTRLSLYLDEDVSLVDFNFFLKKYISLTHLTLYFGPEYCKAQGEKIEFFSIISLKLSGGITETFMQNAILGQENLEELVLEPFEKKFSQDTLNTICKLVSLKKLTLLVKLKVKNIHTLLDSLPHLQHLSIPSFRDSEKNLKAQTACAGKGIDLRFRSN